MTSDSQMIIMTAYAGLPASEAVVLDARSFILPCSMHIELRSTQLQMYCIGHIVPSQWVQNQKELQSVHNWHELLSAYPVCIRESQHDQVH